MKTKSFILLLFSSIIYSGFAQVKGKDREWGCALAMNSIQAQIEIPLLTGPGALLVDADGNILTGGKRQDRSFSFSIIPKYRIDNDILLRLELGITNLKLEASSDQITASTHSLSDRTIKTTMYRFAPGFQWTFMKTKKLESYCGIIASYVNYNNVNDSYNFEVRDLSTDTVIYWGKQTEITPGGFAVGIGALAGFNIYLDKRISVGAELSSSALYYKLGGEAKGENVEQALPNPVNTYTTTFTNSYKGFKISKIISSFNFSIWF